MKKYLIIGLGNVGEDYSQTRHNIGFDVVELLADKNYKIFQKSTLASTASFMKKGREVILVKPNTYMNLSGKAVLHWINKERIDLQNTLIITDDIHLPLGKFRLKKNGSDGGHNGLKNIQEQLQTTVYNRFRFGVGGDFPKGGQIDYVLGRWTQNENAKMPELLDAACEAVESFVLAGIQTTMNLFNNKILSP